MAMASPEAPFTALALRNYFRMR